LRLLIASLSGPLVNVATHVIGSLGYAGVALMCATSGVIGLPGTEPTMLFAGFNVYQGKLTLVGIIIAGVVGDTIGASVAYLIGYRASEAMMEHEHSKFHVSRARIARAHRWFDRWGAPVIAFSRLIPLGRAAFPYAAGVAEMPFVRFITFAVIGSIAWMTGLAFLGREVGAGCGLEVACRCGRRLYSASSTAPRSSCRSPHPGTWPSFRGCSAGATATSTRSCGSPSRSRSTPEPPPPW
jgi:membrane protein DedA with SNARE-associated domain